MEESELVDLGVPAEEGDEQGASATQPPTPATPTEGPTVAQLARLREVLVAAHPEAVPELIGGDDLDALLTSVETARAAYARIKSATTQSTLAAIPRGGGTRALDPAA